MRFSTQNESNYKSKDSGASIQSEYDASIDERLPETVTLLTTPWGGKLYLVGTAHFSVESQNDVATVNKLHFTCTEYIRYFRILKDHCNTFFSKLVGTS